MTAEFSTTRRVEFCETDMAGIVHFSNFYRYMEQVEHEIFRSLGLSIVTPYSNEAMVGWPRVSCSCSFKAPARYEDVLDVQLQVTRKGVKSLTMEFRFQRGDVLIATGRLKTVCCLVRHNAPLESIEIPEPFASRISELPPGDAATSCNDSPA